MIPLPMLADRDSYEDAARLIAQYGDHAGFEAASLAERYRELGNYVHFSRWRQIERLIVYLSVDSVLDTIH